MTRSTILAVEAGPAIPDESARWAPMVWAALVFAGLAAWGSLASTGFLEADACTHYIYARHAITRDWRLILDVWGRPLCTALYAVPAWLGHRQGVHLLCISLAIALALITYRIAKGLGYRWPQLAMIFTLAQPLVFLHSFSELTELPFAMLMGLALLAYQTRRFGAMALAISLMPLGRPEGFGFLLLAAFALVLHRRARWLVLLPLPVLAWDYTGWAAWGALTHKYPWWMWLIKSWPYATQSAYERGMLLHFMMLLPAVTSPLIFPAMWAGVWRSFVRAPAERAAADESSDETATADADAVRHRRLCDIVIAVVPLLVLAVHSVLYWRGKMASNGEIRYLMTVTPCWALLAARGWAWTFDHFKLRHVFAWAAVAALAPIAANCFYRVVPLKLTSDWVEAERFIDWFMHSPVRQKYPFLLSSHPGLFHSLNDSADNGDSMREWGKKNINAAPDGTILVWDSTYSLYNADIVRTASVDEILAAGWKPCPILEDEMNSRARAERGKFAWADPRTPMPDTIHWRVFLSPRQIDGTPTDPSSFHVK